MGVLLLGQTSDSNAIPALIVIAGGIVLASIAAALVRRLTSGENRPEVIRTSAGALATLAFSLILIVALVVALGMINEAALTQLSQDVVSFLPKALSAAIVLIVGNIAGAVAEAGVGRSLGHVSPAIRQRVPTFLKILITGFAVIIAANQLGVDTTIVLIVVASIFLAISLAVALLAGLGGRPVAQQIAAGRAVRRELSVGDSVRIGDIEGDIGAIGSTSTQITSAHKVTLVPNLEILQSQLEIIQAVPTIEAVED